MTKEELIEIIEFHALRNGGSRKAIIDAVDAYIASQSEVSVSLCHDDLFHFSEYCGEYYVKLHGGWMPNFADQRNIENLLTTEQVYARWKQYSPYPSPFSK